MELFVNQILAGISTGAIYACMALSRRHDLPGDRPSQFRARRNGDVLDLHLLADDAMGACPIGEPSFLTVAFSFLAGIAIERILFKPLAKAPILTNVAGFIALYAIINSVAGLIWDFTIKQYPTPFGSSPFSRQPADLDPTRPA